MITKTIDEKKKTRKEQTAVALKAMYYTLVIAQNNKRITRARLKESEKKRE